jgi:hypothetical protein
MEVKSKFFRRLFPVFFLDDDPPAGGTPAAPEDASDRMARASEAWRASDTAVEKPAAGDAGGAGAGGGDQAAIDKAAADKKTADDKAAADKTAADAAAAAGDDAKLPYFNDKRFQEIYKAHGEQKAQLDAFQKVFTEGAYQIDSTETLQGVLADSFMLYDIAGGKKHPGELLDVLKGNWTEAQYKGVLQGLADYCLKNGVKPDEKAATAEPWRKELDEIKSKLSASEQKEKDDVLIADRMKHVDAMMGQVEKLCVAQGFDAKADKDEIAEYCVAVAAEVGKNKKVLEQLEKGQYGELERIFTEYHNRLVARAQRLGDRTLKAKQEKYKGLPRQPAGGAPPSKAATTDGKKRDLATSEGRIAAANEEWNRTKTPAN